MGRLENNLYKADKGIATRLPLSYFNCRLGQIASQSWFSFMIPLIALSGCSLNILPALCKLRSLDYVIGVGMGPETHVLSLTEF